MKTNKISRISGLTFTEMMIVGSVVVFLSLLIVSALRSAKAKSEQGRAENQLVEMDGGTYIHLNSIKLVSKSANFALVFGEVGLFETKHPDLKIIGRQVITDGSWIRGVVIWHESRTNEPGR